MSASFNFNTSVGSLITNGPLFGAIMDGAREVGTRLDQRAPGVEFGFNASGPAAMQP